MVCLDLNGLDLQHISTLTKLHHTLMAADAMRGAILPIRFTLGLILL